MRLLHTLMEDMVADRLARRIGMFGDEVTIERAA